MRHGRSAAPQIGGKATYQMSMLKSHASAMPPAPTQPHSTGEPRRRMLRRHVAVRPQVRATRHASSTSRCAVTPFRFTASLRTMNIACSKSSVSGESTTITRRDVPLTMQQHLPMEKHSASSMPAAARAMRCGEIFCCAQISCAPESSSGM